MCWAGGCMSLGKWGLARQRSSWRRPSTSIGLRRCAMLQRGKPSSLGARTSPGVGRRPCRLACATFMARRPPLRQPHRCPRRGPRCIRTARRRRGRRFLRRRRRRRRGGAADVREPSALCAVGDSIKVYTVRCFTRETIRFLTPQTSQENARGMMSASEFVAWLVVAWLAYDLVAWLVVV